MRKTIFIAALCFFMLLSSQAFAAGFGDTKGHWAVQEIDECAAAGIINGYPGNVFKPDNSVSHLEALVMITKSMGLEQQAKDLNLMAGNYNFPAGMTWGREFLALSADKDIINKKKMKDLKTDDPTTRAEAAEFFVNALHLTAGGFRLPFADNAKIPKNYKNSIAAAVKNGVMVGLPDNKFGPTRKVTRAEMVTIISRLIDKGLIDPPIDQTNQLAVKQKPDSAARPVGTVVHMYSHKDKKIHDIPLEEYLEGVVAAEMPAEFPEEALKAQAVAARTYVLKRLQAGGAGTHPGADVCDDHSHSQAWISKEEMQKRWGAIKYYQYYDKIKNAIADTTGMVITYSGSLIDPVYHSSCGGVGTENSEDVWKSEIPYLRSVSCSYEEPDKSKRTVEISLAGAGKKLGLDLTALPVSTGSSLITVVEKNETGRPKLIKIGEKEIPAIELRSLLGLRSTSFTWELEEDKLKITTTGYGHGVGMCQYGAKGYAEKGKDFKEILSHYYTGVKIVQFKAS